MLSPDTNSETNSSCSERRLAANRANAQLSTGPTSEAGKAKSSLNAVKTGLCGRTLLFADEEEAEAYRAHIARLLEYWEPADVREHALVQSLADTQWRLDSIPGLESGLYALGRRRHAEQFAEVEDPQARRVLLHAHIEEVEGKALKNLRLHERRLERRYLADETELERLRTLRFAEEKRAKEEAEQRQKEAAGQQKRQPRTARQQTPGETVIVTVQPETTAEPRLTSHGFEFSTVLETSKKHSLVSNKER